MASFAVILPAAGASRRFHDKHYKKPFAPLNNRPVWLYSAEAFLNRDDVKQLLLVVAPEDEAMFHERFGANAMILGIDVVAGGESRTDSVAAALGRVRPEIDFVAVHDAARPCIAAPWIDSVFAAAQKHGAAMLALPVDDTLKRVGPDGRIEETIPRENLWRAQTPQAFRRDWLAEAYAQVAGQSATDDAELVQRLGHSVMVVPGSPLNIKITTKEDLHFAAQAVKALPKPQAFGPSHPFADDDMWR